MPANLKLQRRKPIRKSRSFYHQGKRIRVGSVFEMRCGFSPLIASHYSEKFRWAATVVKVYANHKVVLLVTKEDASGDMPHVGDLLEFQATFLGWKYLGRARGFMSEVGRYTGVSKATIERAKAMYKKRAGAAYPYSDPAFGRVSGNQIIIRNSKERLAVYNISKTRQLRYARLGN